MKRLNLIIALFIFFINGALGQTNLQKAIYKAYLINTPQAWEKVILSNEKQINKLSKVEKMDLMQCYRGWILALIKNGETDKAKEIIGKIDKRVDNMLLQYPNNAELMCCKGVFLGNKILINKLKILTVGRKSLSYINKAYELDPNNIYIMFEKANSIYYVPKTFGGDKKNALSYYLEVIKRIEQTQQTEQNWIYIQSLITSAKCYEEIGDNKKAKEYYQKVLKKVPNLSIVNKTR